MMDIKAVDQMDPEAALSEPGPDIEESEGLGPEIIGRKIIDPGIDQNK